MTGGGCLFCQIVKGERSAHIVYEGKDVLAFLDLYPCTPGHTLVIPKRHYRSLTELSDGEVAGYFQVIVRLAEKIQKGMEAQGFNMGINDGRAAGQVVQHVHVHIIPRYANDGGGGIQGIVWMRAKGRSLDEIRERIKAAVDSTP